MNEERLGRDKWRKVGKGWKDKWRIVIKGWGMKKGWEGMNEWIKNSRIVREGWENESLR